MRITWQMFYDECAKLAQRLPVEIDHQRGVFGIPTGGSFVALHLASQLGIPLLEEPRPGCLVVDDLIDTGATLLPYQAFYCDVLYRKPHSPAALAPGATLVNEWIHWPWEHSASPTDAVLRLLEFSDGLEWEKWRRLLAENHRAKIDGVVEALAAEAVWIVKALP